MFQQVVTAVTQLKVQLQFPKFYIVFPFHKKLTYLPSTLYTDSPCLVR